MHRRGVLRGISPAGARILAGLLAATAISAARAQDPAPSVMAPGGVAGEKAGRAESNFLLKAHAGGLRETKLAELAVTRAADPRVRVYAQQVLVEQQELADDLAPLLAAAGLDKAAESAAAATGPNAARDASGAEVTRSPVEAPNVPAGVHGRWDRMLQERKLKMLTEKSGADFDQAYLALMIDDQKGAAELFEDGAKKTRATVRELAAKYLPRQRELLEQAELLHKSLK